MEIMEAVFDDDFFSCIDSLRAERFSKREDKILCQNFEVFLAHHGYDSNDKAKIEEILFSDVGLQFRQESGQRGLLNTHYCR